MLGKMEGRRRRGHQRMRWLDGITNAMNMNLGDGEGQGGLASCSPCGHRELDTTAWLNNNNVKTNTSEQAGLEPPNFPTALINKSLGKFLFISHAHISTMSKGSCVRTKEPFSSNTLCSKISIYCRTRAYLVMY